MNRRQLRQLDRAVELARTPGDAPAAWPAMVGQVVTITPVVGKFCNVHPTTVLGTEAEGSSGTLVTVTTPVPVYLLGPAAPHQGDFLVCRFVGHRWVATSGAGSGGNIVMPGCPCPSAPRSLTMVSTNHSANNGIFQDASIAYGPTPTNLLSLGIGANSFLSTASFMDLTTGDTFWYHFGCFFGFYLLTRVYETSLYGSPFRDSTRYRWPIGLSGNTCSPFSLIHGQIFAGGDPSSVVTITG